MKVSADIAVLDQPFAVGNPGRTREADRGGRPRVRDRHHEVGLRRRLGREPLAHSHTYAVHLRAGKSRVGPREVDVLEDAERLPALRNRLRRVQPVLVDHDDFTGPHLALERGGIGERARLRGEHPVLATILIDQPADRERADPVGVAESEQLPVGQRHDRVGAFEPRHRTSDRERKRRGVVGDQRGDRLGVRGGAERNPVRGERVAQLLGVRQVAVVAERDRPCGAVVDEWLCVAQSVEPVVE